MTSTFSTYIATVEYGSIISKKHNYLYIGVAFGMSFIKRKNNNGPKTEPCGTPHLIVWLSNDVLFKLIYC